MNSLGDLQKTGQLNMLFIEEHPVFFIMFLWCYITWNVMSYITKNVRNKHNDEIYVISIYHWYSRESRCIFGKTQFYVSIPSLSHFYFQPILFTASTKLFYVHGNGSFPMIKRSK